MRWIKYSVLCIYFPWLCSVHQVHFGLTSWSSWNRWKEHDPQKKKKRTESKWPLIWYWFCKLSASVTCFSSCAFSKVLHSFLHFSLTWPMRTFDSTGKIPEAHSYACTSQQKLFFIFVCGLHFIFFNSFVFICVQSILRTYCSILEKGWSAGKLF